MSFASLLLATIGTLWLTFGTLVSVSNIGFQILQPSRFYPFHSTFTNNTIPF